LRRRLLLSYLSLTLFVLLALELPLGLSFANAERRRVTGDVQTDAFALALRVDEVLSAPEPTSNTSLRHLVRTFRRQTGLSAAIVDANGVVVSSVGGREPDVGLSVASEPEMAAALKGRDTTRERSLQGDDVLSVAVPVLGASGTVGAVRVTSTLAEVSENSSRNWLLLGALGGIVSLVVLLVSVLLARSFTRPLAELDAGAARLGEGDLGARVPVPADPPELHGLAVSFNATAERLETLVRSQQTFVADASHQLRTPLAALSLRLENLEAEEPDLRHEDLDGAHAEVRRLARLVDGLLVLARAEQAPVAMSSVSVRDVIDGRIDAWTAAAEERGVRLDADVEDHEVRSVPGRLEQVLDNLLSNALDVAPSGTTVSLDAVGEGTQVRIEVRDHGPGMTAEQRARAFDRFWRAGTRTHQNGNGSGSGSGFGLGLAIVHRLVRADGGEVSLDDAAGGGLAVVVRLPATPVPAPVPV